MHAEEIVFPWLNTKMDFAPEHEAHKVIHAGLDKFNAHVDAAKADPSKFDAQALAQILRDMREPLVSPSTHCAGAQMLTS